MFELIILSLALSMDAFSICVGYGSCFKNASRQSIFRLSFHTALFQALMPLGGWWGGKLLSNVMSMCSDWLAAGLLILIGIKMLIDGLKKQDDCELIDISTGKRLYLVCLATSIDAFAAGMSLGILDFPLLFSILIIGITTFIMSLLGIFLGKLIGFILEKWAEALGALIIIGIGIKIIAVELFF